MEVNRDIDVDIDDDDIKTHDTQQSIPRYKIWRASSVVRGQGFAPQQQLFNQHFFIQNIITKNSTDSTPTTQQKHTRDPDLLRKSDPTAVRTERFHTTAEVSSSLRHTHKPQPISIPPITKNVKILVLGNAKCGKSSLINRYCHDTFSEKYKTTIGADFIRKDIAYRGTDDKHPVGIRLQVCHAQGSGHIH
jgi:hypothetical protein